MFWPSASRIVGRYTVYVCMGVEVCLCMGVEVSVFVCVCVYVLVLVFG